MEIPCRNRTDIRWRSKGRRSKRPDVDEIAAAEALILLANCDGGFCPSFPTTARAPAPKNFASFPRPNLSPASVSATNPAAVNVNTPLIHPEKNHHQQQLSTASPSTAVNVKNIPERYSPDTPLMANSPIFHPKKHQQQPPTASPSATTSAALNVKNQELYSDYAPDTPLMEISSILHPKKHQQQQPSWGTATASASGTTAAAVNVHSPYTPIMAVAHHDCLVCGKRFQTHQALGGHMTSHRLKPETTTVSDDRGDGNSSAVKRGRTHECTLCHEQFSTGQALGGHKRKHYDGPSLARKSANCRRSISFHIGRDDGGAATILVSRPSIDLNMPPPEE